MSKDDSEDTVLPTQLMPERTSRTAAKGEVSCQLPSRGSKPVYLFSPIDLGEVQEEPNYPHGTTMQMSRTTALNIPPKPPKRETRCKAMLENFKYRTEIKLVRHHKL